MAVYARSLSLQTNKETCACCVSATEPVILDRLGLLRTDSLLFHTQREIDSVVGPGHQSRAYGFMMDVEGI